VACSSPMGGGNSAEKALKIALPLRGGATGLFSKYMSVHSAVINIMCTTLPTMCLLIAVAITACIVGIVIKPTSEPTSWGPLPPNYKEMEEKIVPKFERVEIELGESATVKGNLIKLISVEEEKGIVKIEVYNETTGESMVVPLSLRGGEAFKYKNIAIIPLSDTIKDDRITFLIAEVAYSEEDMRSQ